MNLPCTNTSDSRVIMRSLNCTIAMFVMLNASSNFSFFCLKAKNNLQIYTHYSPVNERIWRTRRPLNIIALSETNCKICMLRKIIRNHCQYVMGPKYLRPNVIYSLSTIYTEIMLSIQSIQTSEKVWQSCALTVTECTIPAIILLTSMIYLSCCRIIICWPIFNHAGNAIYVSNTVSMRHIM